MSCTLARQVADTGTRRCTFLSKRKVSQVRTGRARRKCRGAGAEMEAFVPGAGHAHLKDVLDMRHNERDRVDGRFARDE
jgi:hypothetical protein